MPETKRKYDPVKRKEYYERTKQLKGRRKAQAKDITKMDKERMNRKSSRSEDILTTDKDRSNRNTRFANSPHLTYLRDRSEKMQRAIDVLGNQLAKINKDKGDDNVEYLKTYIKYIELQEARGEVIREMISVYETNK